MFLRIVVTKDNFLHHLSERTIRKYHHWIAIFVGKVEAIVNEISHFLHARRRKDDDMVIAMAAAFRRLKIISLRRLNRSEPGSTAIDIHN